MVLLVLSGSKDIFVQDKLIRGASNKGELLKIRNLLLTLIDGSQKRLRNFFASCSLLSSVSEDLKWQRVWRGFVKLINVNWVMNYFKESVEWWAQGRGSIPFNVQEGIMLIFGTVFRTLGLCKSLSGAALKISCSWQLKQLRMTLCYIIHDATLLPVWTNFHSISDFQFYTKPCNLFFLVTLLWLSMYF